MRVIMCGGREFTNYRAVVERVGALPDDTVVIEGDAAGADRLCGAAAKAQGLAVIPVPITKGDWARYGKRAGRIRNQKMLDMKPDLVIAFPGGNGTAHMVEIAEAAGVPVERIGWQA